MSCQTTNPVKAEHRVAVKGTGQDFFIKNRNDMAVDIPAGGAGAGVLGCVSPGVEGVGVFGEGEPG